ncbi:BQ5605_C039g11759 [Microbotryum silenes-dioicae]|uniref:BQ5605_C039g11759 protein n=1 Tax=Microbotryum silenes-dioicae TaxID=796604 RepID=A0A2X0P9R4_9BASI|nr:BQ5605_C039g11759 [Microbotryum silenes-dioicae]
MSSLIQTDSQMNQKHRTQAKRTSPDPLTPRSWATMFVRRQRPFRLRIMTVPARK